MIEKVSVIIPVYNVEKYLNKCVDSVINQTYKNIEIILIDDGSPDNCPKICDEYAEKDDRVTVIHKENGWLSSARNAGMDIMTGDYVTFIDSDDYVKENMIERMVELMTKHNADVVQVESCSDETEFRKSNITQSEEIIVGIDNWKLCIEQKKICIRACGKLYRSEKIKNLRFLETLRCAEDNEFGYRFYKNVEKTVICNEKLYFYFLKNQNSIMHNAGKDYLLWTTWYEVYQAAEQREKDCVQISEMFYMRKVKTLFEYYFVAAERKDFELCKTIRDKTLKVGGIKILTMDFQCKMKYLLLLFIKDAKRYLSVYEKCCGIKLFMKKLKRCRG